MEWEGKGEEETIGVLGEVRSYSPGGRWETGIRWEIGGKDAEE